MIAQLRVLFHSNAPWVASGYGTQTKYALQQFDHLKLSRKLDVEVAMSAFYGLQGGNVEISGRRFYGNPHAGDPWGNTSVREWYEDFDANLLITLMDAFMFNHTHGLNMRWAPWYPVDHEPVPPAVVGHLRHAAQPIAMSQFGQAQSALVEIDAAYVPHSIPTEIFRQYTDEERGQFRDWLGIPRDKFVFGIVAANNGIPSRKAFPELFLAFQRVAEGRDDVLLYVHSDAEPTHIGLNLPQLAEQMLVLDKVRFTSKHGLLTQFATEDAMARLYGAFDAFVLPSYGEGFGVPLIEAQACGVPVIAHDATAMSELVAGGLLIEKGEHVYSQQRSFWFMPHVADIAEQMTNMLEMSTAERRVMGQGAAQFVRDNYDCTVVRDKYWLPLLSKLAEKEAAKVA